MLGHLAEMVQASRAGVMITTGGVPMLPGALALAEQGLFSGGMRRNRRHVETVLGPRLEIGESVAPALVALLFEAETSGGLVFSIGRDRAAHVIDDMRARGEDCWEIGEVLADPVIRIRA
jgi:selenide,water dikinase